MVEHSRNGLTRRQLLQSGLALSAASVLAACGGGSNAGPSSSGSSYTGAGEIKGVDLSMYHWWGTQFDHYNPIVDQLTGIKVSQTDIPFNSFAQKLLTALAGGSGPDFFLWAPQNNGELFFNDSVVVFDDYLKAHQKTTDPKKWDVSQSKEVGVGGKTYGLSVFTAQDMAIYINQELAEQQGLTKGLPVWGSSTYDTWHWDDMIQFAKEATRYQNGELVQAGMGNGGNNVLLKYLIADLGGKLFDDDWNYDETKILLTSDEAITAGQMLTDLYVKYKVTPPPAPSGSTSVDPFQQKRALATINWQTPSAYPVATTFPQMYLALPWVHHRTHGVGANQLMISKASPHQEAALDWITTLLTNTHARTVFFQVSSVPAYDPLPIVKAAPEGPSKTLGLMNLSRLPGFSTVPKLAENVNQFPQSFGRYASTITQTTITNALTQVQTSNGRTSVKQAFTQAKETIDAAIKQARASK